MPAPGPSTGRRLACAVAALALAAAAFLFAATWFAGARTWPPGEDAVERRITTAPEELAKRLPRDDATKPLRIGVVGDIQNGVSELSDLLDALREERVDLIVQLGDVANGGQAGRYAVVRRVFEEHAPGIPVLAVPGNHDIGPGDSIATWTRWVGPPQWRADVRGWRIVGIDDALGTISPDSMDLLRVAARDAPPACGTIVVAHRPLAGGDGAPEHDPWEARAQQLAKSGLVPTATLSGHWHHNDSRVDELGVWHYLVGENCDRSSSGEDAAVTKPILTLSPPGANLSHGLRWEHVDRRVRVSGEFLRLAVGGVYPALRQHAVVGWVAALACVVASWRLVRAALRRAPASA
jgi:hypothetical protein